MAKGSNNIRLQKYKKNRIAGNTNTEQLITHVKPLSFKSIDDFNNFKAEMKVLSASRPLNMLIFLKMPIAETRIIFRKYHYEQENLIKKYCEDYVPELWPLDDHRNSEYYKNWRSVIFTRDNWTCQHCKSVGGELNAHHIKSWIDYPELRLDIDNGITLCIDCHKKVHSAKRLENNKNSYDIGNMQ